jgi:DNA-binding FadR family transcriptional regulator
MTPGAPLPTELELSTRFGVSRLVVREAVHRLKHYELVAVHQGSRTVVLDPDRTTNIYLLGLESEVLSHSSDWLAAFAERQFYSAAALLALAEQRIEPHRLDELETITEDLAQVPASSARSDGFEHVRAYWLVIARSTKNRLYVRDAAWHFKMLERRPHVRAALMWPAECLAVIHRRLNATLRERRGSAAAYLEIVHNLWPHTTCVGHTEASSLDEASSSRGVSLAEASFRSKCAVALESR